MGRDPPDVAPDGSPVEVYLAVPAEPEFTPLLDDLPETATVLDLGCGVGRLANLLAARGYSVVGVDESAAMLEHVAPPVETVETRVEELDLGRRFDVIVLASHLINAPDAGERAAILAAVGRHLGTGGVVYIEHYDPQWSQGPPEGESELGDVKVSLEVLARRGSEFDGAVTYQLGESKWVQTFTAVVLDEQGLDAALATAGLRRRRRLTANWLVAGPDPVDGEN